MLVSADAPIPEALPTYYFEVKIDHTGKEGRIFIGLASAMKSEGSTGIDSFSKVMLPI